MRLSFRLLLFSSATALVPTAESQIPARLAGDIGRPVLVAPPADTPAQRAASLIQREPVTFELAEEPSFWPRAIQNPDELSDEESARLEQSIDTSGMYSRLHWDETHAEVWVRGRSFKAHLAPSGFTYIPFLGSNAPRNFPVDFRLASATLGDVELALEPTARVTRDGDRVVLDRGPIQVVYDFALESVEQSFLVDVTGASGDLVLTLDVESELEARARAAGFRFAGGLGGVDYGAAIVLDSAGREEHVPARLMGGTLTLEVPAAFVERAGGPIIVDPIISTYTIDDYPASSQQRADIVYDLATDRYTAVYQEVFSFGDADVFAIVFDSTIAEVDIGFLEFTTNTWRRLGIGNLHHASKNLVTAERNGSDVMGRVLDVASADPLSTGSWFVIDAASPSAWTSLRPDVAGQSTSDSSAKFMVVWERQYLGADADPHAALVSSSGVVSSSSAIEIDLARSEHHVTVSRTAGDPATVNRFNIGYFSKDVLSGGIQLRTVQLAATGGMLAVPHDIGLFDPSRLELTTDAQLDVSEALAMAGSGVTYLVAATRDTTYGGTDVFVCRDADVLRRYRLSELDNSNLFNGHNPTLATAPGRFILSSSNYYAGLDTTVIEVSSYDLVESSHLAVSEAAVRAGDRNGLWKERISIASRYSSGATSSSRSIVAWGRDQAFESGVFDIVGATFDATTPPSPAWQYCDVVPNSTGVAGFLLMHGDRSVTSPKTLIASRLPLNSVGFFITSRAMGFFQNPGGSQGILCLSGSIGRFLGGASSSGPTGTISMVLDPLAMAQPLGSVSAIAGERWNFQLWHRDTVGGVATNNFTKAVSLLFE